MIATLEAPPVEHAPQAESDDSRCEELFARFEFGDKLSHAEKDELIRLLFRKVKDSRWQADDGKTRVGKVESTRLWEACQGIIRRAERFGLMGLHWNREQAAIHPLADEAAAIFMEFITRYDGPDTEAGNRLLTKVRNRLNSDKNSLHNREEMHCAITDTISGNLKAEGHDPKLERLRARVREEVEKLPELQRSVIQRFAKGIAVAEIASARSVTPSAIYEHIDKAHEKLRPSLKPLWEEYQEILLQRRMQNSRPRRNLASAGEDASA